ncbi:MAG: AbrB/MazE/SpoVT family DNA-binding domain-containing protein [Enterobacterales bacterium]|nr:AbrB/MazE/SpoVT family DNA-binding domain-containing protein [Enterobacterales bacterium]
MLSVKVSPKFQVVIPKEIRESLDVSPGQLMQVIAYENRIEFIPEKDISELEGFLKGINTTFERDDDRI